MSYWAFWEIKKNMEIETLKKMSLEEINDVLVSQHQKIKKLEDQLSNSYELTKLIHWAFNNHVQVAQYGTWFGTYTGEERPSGSNGCISYKQTFLTALRQAKATLGT